MRQSISLLLLGSIIFPVLVLLSGCYPHSEAWTLMDRADTLMWSQPDSAYMVLKDIDTLLLRGNEERARYALLMSMAMDRNYIDTTAFAVLQPAIDYYIKDGDPDERLRTYYYQGCIYKNRKDYDNAMMAFLNAESQIGLTDSLVLANTLSAMGKIYHMQYKLPEMVEANLRAAQIYQSHMKHTHAFKSYCRAFNGEIMSNNKPRADSLKEICLTLSRLAPEADHWLDNILLMDAIRFGTQDEFNAVVNKLPAELDEEMNVGLAQGYAKFGDYSSALNYFRKVSSIYEETYPLKYYGIETNIYDGLGDYERAFEVYSEYVDVLQKYYFDMLSRDLIFVEKKHAMVVENLLALRQRDRLILSIICLTFIVLSVALFLYIRYRSVKNQKTEVEQQNSSLLEERSSLDKENIQLKQDREAQEEEIISKASEIDRLQSETLRLKEELHELQTALEKDKNLSNPLREAIKRRISFLNSLLASEITNEESYAKPFREWISSIHKDKKEFLNSTRLAFMWSHPNFIRHLETHYLTQDEINYVCLYALQLRGKEVGDFIQFKSHYNMSSGIRKKLGLDSHSTNLGNYIRRLLEES